MPAPGEAMLRARSASEVCARCERPSRRCSACSSSSPRCSRPARPERRGTMRPSTSSRTLTSRLVLLALAVGVVMSLSATQAVAAPANDDRGSPVVIGNPPSPVSGDTSQATADPSDPIPFCSGSALAGTLWYSWTPSVTGNVKVDLQAGAGTVPIAAFFTVDSSGNLTQVFCTTGGQATFSFTAGQPYLIMVGQYTGCCSPGPFTLTLTPPAPPPPLFLGYLGPRP